MNTQTTGADAAVFQQRELNKLTVGYVLACAAMVGWFVWVVL